MKISALQLAHAFAATPQEFFDRVREPIERAVHDGAQLVVLPNYTGMLLLGAVAPISGEHIGLPLPDIARMGGYASTAAMLRAVAPALREFHLHLFGSLAARLQIYLAPGTVVEREGDQLYNAAYLFAPDGKVIGTQRQTHRTRDEMAWGIAQGDTLRAFEIERARVGLVSGEDVSYPEVSRILALKGANLLIHPAAYETWSPQHFLLDLWRDVQSNQVFGVQACLAGKGRSAIYAPVEMTEGKRGLLAQANGDAEQIVTAPLDFTALQQVVDNYPIFNFFNHDFYSREFPNIYHLNS